LFHNVVCIGCTAKGCSTRFLLVKKVSSSRVKSSAGSKWENVSSISELPEKSNYSARFIQILGQKDMGHRRLSAFYIHRSHCSCFPPASAHSKKTSRTTPFGRSPAHFSVGLFAAVLSFFVIILHSVYSAAGSAPRRGSCQDRCGSALRPAE